MHLPLSPRPRDCQAGACEDGSFLWGKAEQSADPSAVLAPREVSLGSGRPARPEFTQVLGGVEKGGWGWGMGKEELRTRQVGGRGSHLDPQRRGTPGICGSRAGGGRGWRFGSQPSRRPTFLQDHFPLLNAGYSPCCAEVAATSSPWTSAPGFRFPSSSARGEAFLLLPGFGQFILKLCEPTEPVSSSRRR